MTVMEAIAQRTSVRSYLPKPVEKEKLDRILEAGRLAPSANNTQSWKFVVVTDEKRRAQMVEACTGQKFVGEAPVVLVVCANQKKIMRCGMPARTIDCSIALSFMILEAAELGLGTCWLGAFQEDEVRRILNVPEDYDIVAVTPLGYPASPAHKSSRKPIEEILVKETF